MNSSSGKEEIQRSRKEVCKLHGIDYQKVEDIHSKIASLLQGIKTKTRVQKTLDEAVVGLKRGVKYLDEINKIASEKLTPRQKSLLDLLSYLGVSEGAFSELTQLITFILVENGHDIYDPIRTKFVKNYKGLDKVVLFIKLQFVEEHGFKFITNVFDRELRNCIAHLNFVIKDDGTIEKVSGEKLTKEELSEKIRKLAVMCGIVIDIFSEELILK